MPDFGVLKRTNDRRRYYHPQSNTRRERKPSSNEDLPQMYEFSKTALPEQTAPARRQPSLNRQHPLQVQGRLRVGSKTRTEPYDVLLYCLQQYKNYTINSAYHIVVVEEGWAGHEDVSGKRESSAELPSSCSLHDAPRQRIAPNSQLPRAAIDGMIVVRPFSSCSLELPSTACPYSGTANSKPA